MSGRVAVRVVIRVALFAAVCGVLAMFATYVWPTPWRYDHMTVDGEAVLVRIDRVSGEAEMLIVDEGWVPVADHDMHGRPEPDRL
jgi:hypothetical protein